MACSSLSTTSKLEVFTIIEACTNLKTEDEFKDVLEKVRNLFGPEMIACGVGGIRLTKVSSIINLGFSTDFIAAIIDTTGRMKSPLFHRWVVNQLPQTLDFKENSVQPTPSHMTPYRDFSLCNVISHGVIDCSQRYATYFGFAKIPERIGPHHISLLEILAPHLHVAYTQLGSVKKLLLSTIDTAFIDDDSIEPLSEREREVLRWLFAGKSNWDIGSILKISENTVKNHVQRIIKKLNANNRQHAVAKALRIGLIKL